mmetsp:Transcript_46888/g.149475  ORF Transcript_46888/g.149475 Transcript_46888/m.149475 type:complete len:262 (+) Transcript_46888:508-1293(+)
MGGTRLRPRLVLIGRRGGIHAASRTLGRGRDGLVVRRRLRGQRPLLLARLVLRRLLVLFLLLLLFLATAAAGLTRGRDQRRLLPHGALPAALALPGFHLDAGLGDRRHAAHELPHLAAAHQQLTRGQVRSEGALRRSNAAGSDAAAGDADAADALANDAAPRDAHAGHSPAGDALTRGALGVVTSRLSKRRRISLRLSPCQRLGVRLQCLSGQARATLAWLPRGHLLARRDAGRRQGRGAIARNCLLRVGGQAVNRLAVVL